MNNNYFDYEIQYDEREEKYAIFATENGGAIKYCNTLEESIRFIKNRKEYI